MGDNSIVGAVAAASSNLCVSNSIPGTGSNTWIIDIGASDHMTYDANFFDELSSNTRDPYITSANGLPSPIIGEGTISLTPTLSLSRSQDSRDDWAWYYSPNNNPITPQQNGVSERKNRQLLELARSLILDMSVPHHLWGHAVLSAAYLINRTPSRVFDFKTPHDVFSDHVSLLSVSKLLLKVFGYIAYVHVYSHQRSKLDHCALRCVFIGYSSTHKCYKCYHPPTQKVHITLDVTFHEEVPYYVSHSSPIQREKGSELESLGFENDVSEDTAFRKETTCRTEASALGVETTDHTEASDQSPVSENNDSDSCMDEFDGIPPFALPVCHTPDRLRRSTILSALGLPHCLHGFVSGSSRSNFPGWSPILGLLQPPTRLTSEFLQLRSQ
ncbi:hypothetical protein L3X38_002960 [Prunus dulcis]|uniref:Integrase catalytic domain-containing protein n=1 Tax=Prunus dulcis TaxID=3755 RepID=A0AAD4WUZ9_PRUDU|nr:hypothetical protein L3X38_002960 [Prunus dulcis]